LEYNIDNIAADKNRQFQAFFQKRNTVCAVHNSFRFHPDFYFLEYAKHNLFSTLKITN
jgi:hypothetical protein